MARDPNSCPMGHVACRSCYLEDILAQKNSFKLKKAEYEREIAEINGKISAEEEGKRTENFKQFVKQQGAGTGSASGTKRSFDQTESGVMVISEHPSNRVSSHLTPQVPKEEICCRAGLKGPHPLYLKHLLSVNFSEPEKSKPGCPVCLKPFNSSNAFKGCLFRGCGHVVCEGCYKRLSCGNRKCLVCEKDSSSEVIVLESEGTGFAAGGGIVEAKRYDLAFQ